MGKVYYCVECKRVIENDKVCDYCKSENLKQLTIKAPVNVIGTKVKGKVFKLKDGKVDILIRNEANEKLLKEYEPAQLKKLL
ncbi:hypothetical protein Ccar_23820 [Clostridium carboxidivorans P7]|uniref:Uncharacterized protein n=1 Tax=Clostridium carboxidivorans P7 TaxID=536227 RepID=C6PYV7_9CLOT|nr:MULTISPECIES: hypothetical protein [Clostridium]AKN33685.1 hypothetical protein Ccar_23820 [Clostridium carboxidivorans P7]EET85588.1 conserved hypothetical protein [Clostridium carboxidivorans P7]EFG86717.1 hypothetical protein CLCAR_3669 [Clostridium carboxidivorans P7]WPC42573.1 hypothetical protein Q6H37_03645 [Clostridium sp. JS66]